jgi:hypothetical protein
MNNDELPENDNLELAMNKVAETMDFLVSTNLGEDGPSNKQVIVRTTDKEHERWKSASQKDGKSMSQFIRDCVNEKVTDILDCSHPLNQRRYYPWASFCMRCNARFESPSRNSK